MPDDNAVQASVVLHLLGRAGAYPRAELSAALGDIAADQLAAALDSLTQAGVVRSGSRDVQATEAVRRLDELGLIAI
jgi:ubiquinone biosynthesis protein UbiJ